MSPPISKDWWIAAALTSAMVPAAAQSPAGVTPPAGVVAAVTPDAPVTSNDQTVLLGNSIAPGQRLRTGPNGQVHILLLDQSALTLGADSELLVEAFQFDPASGQGQIRLGLTQGVLRVVGGHISKRTATTIATPHGQVAILGGITIVESSNAGTHAQFLFGQSMQVTDNAGNTQQVVRPGFGVSIVNGAVSPPDRSTPAALGQLLARLERQPSGTPASNPAFQPVPTPLISTGGQPGAAPGLGNTLATDRLKTAIDTQVSLDPTQNLRNILGSVNTPIQS